MCTCFQRVIGLVENGLRRVVEQCCLAAVRVKLEALVFLLKFRQSSDRGDRPAADCYRIGEAHFRLLEEADETGICSGVGILCVLGCEGEAGVEGSWERVEGRFDEMTGWSVLWWDMECGGGGTFHRNVPTATGR